MPRLYQKYQKEIRRELKAKLKLANDLAVPRLEAVIISIGTGKALSDEKYLETMKKNLAAITGQWPTVCKAQEAVSNFKIRKGMVVGLLVTLRGKRMYEFVDRLISITLPRSRDFRGLSPDSFDDQGNYSLGFKEHVSFPEIHLDQIEKVHGLGITIKTTAQDKKTGLLLLTALGFPFSKEKKSRKKKRDKRAFLSQEKAKKEEKKDETVTPAAKPAAAKTSPPAKA